MADTSYLPYKIISDFDKDGTLDSIWAGLADKISTNYLSDSLYYAVEDFYGTNIEKLSIKPASKEILGGIKLKDDGVEIITVDEEGYISINETDNFKFINSTEKNALSKLSSLTTANLTDSTDKRFITDKQRETLQLLSGEEGVDIPEVTSHTHTTSSLTVDPDYNFVTDVQLAEIKKLTDANHPATHSAIEITETETKKFVSNAEKLRIPSQEMFNKLTELTTANHSSKHNTAEITESGDKYFVSNAEKQSIAKISSLEEKIQSVESAEKTIEKFTVQNAESPKTIFSLTNSEKKKSTFIKFYVNGILYQNIRANYNSSDGYLESIEWQDTEASGGFDITTDFEVVIEY